MTGFLVVVLAVITVVTAAALGLLLFNPNRCTADGTFSYARTQVTLVAISLGAGAAAVLLDDGAHEHVVSHLTLFFLPVVLGGAAGFVLRRFNRTN